MDDEYMFNEKQSIRDSARTLKKYGSTGINNHIRNNETLIRHEIEKTDTLQGIALKFGCTTEQIRRTNRLFASDSLFLRQFLMVPVDKTSPYYPRPDENNATILADAMMTTTTTTTPAAATITTLTPATTTASTGMTSIAGESASASSTEISMMSPLRASKINQLPQRPYSIAGELLVLPSSSDDDTANQNTSSSSSSGSGSGTSSSNSKSLDSVVVTTAMTPEEENRKCINDFLNKIDTTISESRKYVEKSKEMINSQSDEGIFVATEFVQRRRNNHLNNSYKNNQQNNQPQHMRQSSTGSTSDTAHLLNTTQTRRVQNSLKRLEKQQDDFFQL